ncbi:hypothetical protein HH1059_03380 [Halorhodospira halochloris]|uniref:ParB/Sulfiredoxin domain-containing protein n=1 Tax=Halorhodospira halochloris TaxID=1052 RepID=A0A0X8X7P8_HALHR|nr:hypothetical protein [Halorhodospira halochloris]BAU57016.1 hypothetical protein HH1059_03380 [Halorhodospira halochloris]
MLARRGSVIIETNPLNIEYLKMFYEWPGYLKRWPFWICGGTWDLGGQALEPFREAQIREIWLSGGKYKDTDCYGQMREQLERLGYIKNPRMQSVAELDSYFDRQWKLLLELSHDGYKEQSALGGKPGHEITVRIDRDGRLVKCREGSHRLAMLRVLGITRAPVTIDIVHSKWALADDRAAPTSGSLAAKIRARLEQDYGQVLAWPSWWPNGCL